jgi:hypothetical protein
LPRGLHALAADHSHVAAGVGLTDQVVLLCGRRVGLAGQNPDRARRQVHVHRRLGVGLAARRGPHVHTDQEVVGGALCGGDDVGIGELVRDDGSLGRQAFEIVRSGAPATGGPPGSAELQVHEPGRRGEDTDADSARPEGGEGGEEHVARGLDRPAVGRRGRAVDDKPPKASPCAARSCKRCRVREKPARGLGPAPANARVGDHRQLAGAP